MYIIIHEVKIRAGLNTNLADKHTPFYHKYCLLSQVDSNLDCYISRYVFPYQMTSHQKGTDTPHKMDISSHIVSVWSHWKKRQKNSHGGMYGDICIVNKSMTPRKILRME